MQTRRPWRPRLDARAAARIGVAAVWLALVAACGTGDGDVSAPPVATASAESASTGSTSSSTSPTTSSADGTANREAPTTTAEPPAVMVEPRDCPTPFPATGNTCGLATVPIDRDDPGAGTTTISLIVVPGHDQDASPPVAVLQGGPGGASSELSLYYPRRAFTQVFIDQRGTGFGEADFDCPEVDDVLGDILAVPSDEAEVIELAAYDRCAARLVTDPVFATTDTTTLAADVADVMAALGHERWLAYGVSYGTTIALQLMRTAPPGLRGTILDGVYPLDLDVDAAIADSAESALAALDRACAADEACAAINSDVTGSLVSLMGRLQGEPITVPIESLDVDVVIDGNALAGIVFRFMYDESQLRFVPGLLDGLDRGDTGTARWLAEAIVTLSIASLVSNDDGTWFAVQCADRLPFTDGPPDELSDFAEAIAVPGLDELCDPWSRDPSPAALAEPVHSDIPALIVGGQFDPITPPAFAEQVAAELGAATTAIRPGLGHGVWFGDDCVAALVDSFVADPTRALDTSCAELPVPVDWGRPAG